MSIDFDSSNITSQYVFLNSTDTSNIWQIGSTNKFTGPYSLPNSIVTDTVNAYPVSNSSSFILKFDLIQLMYSSLVFKHSYNTDTLTEGGYVEYSIDNGSNWCGVSPNSWNACFGSETTAPIWSTYGTQLVPRDTLPNGRYVFSGTRSGESWMDFPCLASKRNVQFWLRFTFLSDSIQTGKQGWLIDNIHLVSPGGIACTDISEVKESEFEVYPNPTENTINVRLNANKNTEYFACIIDVSGRIMQSEIPLSIGNNTIQINMGSDGIYFIRLRDNDGNVSVKKISKQR